MNPSPFSVSSALDLFFPLSAKAKNEMTDAFHRIEIGRKQSLTIAGDNEKWLYLVEEGIQRVYAIDEKGREATIVFTYAPSFGGVIDSLLLGSKSKYHYETLTRSVLWRLHKDDLNRLSQTYDDVKQLVDISLQRAFSGVLDRLVDLQILTSEEKFRKLLARSPHILSLVPHKYLANYLGIDATNFSKLMNSVRI